MLHNNLVQRRRSSWTSPWLAWPSVLKYPPFRLGTVMWSPSWQRMIWLNIDSGEKQFAFSYVPNYLHIQIHTYHKLSQHVANSAGPITAIMIPCREHCSIYRGPHIMLKVGCIRPPFNRVRLSRIFAYPASVSDAHFCYQGARVCMMRYDAPHRYLLSVYTTDPTGV